MAMKHTLNATYGGEDIPLDEALEAATKAGEEAGKAAASWAFDGNTVTETYRKVLAGIEDGDPAILDAYDEPGINGSSEFTSRDLCDEIGVDYDLSTTRDVDKISDAYEQAAQETFWTEIEHAARQQLS
jgi:hypothetical protein